MTGIDSNTAPLQQSLPRWRLHKRRMVLRPPANHPQWKTHAQAPTLLKLSRERWIVYFAGRDDRNRSRVYGAELDPADLSVRCIYPDSVLDLGGHGAFDEHGVGAGTAICADGRIRLYYIGVKCNDDGTYVTGIGIAESIDGGRSFRRLQQTPVIGAGADSPWGATSPTVLIEGKTWVMWYSSFWAWRDVDGKPEPIYDIHQAFSDDGFIWRTSRKAALSFASDDEGGLIRPQVLRHGRGQLLIMASRGWRDFRQSSPNSYRFVYARSTDGDTWTRDPDAIEIDPADTADGWDSEMRCYPWLVEDKQRRLLFYNGNDFGRHGFGVGELLPVEKVP
jgi:hypothetical protein